jgi:TM2 domain-containing membrane protein YozV
MAQLTPTASAGNSAVNGDWTNDFTPQQKLFFHQEYDKLSRNPSTALVLALLLGGAGAHRFYLRQWGWGIAYIVFAWTFIPLVVALFECFVIKKRTERYNDDLRGTIVQKAAVIFSEPKVVVSTS